MASHLERNHVGKLVPQCRSPVERAGFPRAWGVESYHLAEADAQRAQPREAECPNRKTAMIGENLHLQGPRGREAVFLA